MNSVVFVGKMQSGKSSACNLLVGEVMKRTKKVPEYRIDEDGDLVIPVIQDDKVVFGKFDLNRIDYDFRNWCQNNLWSDVRVFNFAESLKLCTHYLFDIPLAKIYGTNEDKNTITHILNEKLGHVAKEPKDKPLTVREVLQRFGKICRDIDEDCFLNYVVRAINSQDSKLSLVGDCRYPNEIKGMKEIGAKLVKLKRDPVGSNVESEKAQSEIKDDFYDLIIPSSANLEQKNEMILESCDKWGVF
jgi:hypothetical protein